MDPAASERNIAWARRTYDAMRPWAAKARYVNYLDHDDAADVAESVYGPNYARLRTVKARYDPTNVFHLNQNIQPVASQHHSAA